MGALALKHQAVLLIDLLPDRIGGLLGLAVLWVRDAVRLAIVSPMADEQETISQAALEAVGNLLETGKIHGIGITFEPDVEGWSVGYMRGMGGGNLASAYDLETAARAAERPLDELARRLEANQR